MKVATASYDYSFSVNGFVVKNFEKNKSYIMSEMLMKDIMSASGSRFFINVRDLDSKTYKKYNGEDLTDKTITIWRTGGMGDLCFITPYLKKIKQMWPTSKIIFGCGAQYSDVMSKHQFVDEFYNLPIDTDVLARANYHLMFEGIIEANLDAHKKNAYDLFGEYFNIQLDETEKFPNLPLELENLEYFNKVEEKYIKVKTPIRVAIHLKTSSEIRNVPAALWTKIVYALLGLHPDVVVYLVGAPDDSDVGSKIPIADHAMGRILPFYQVVRGFRDNIAAISKMHLMIGGDSSGVHIAAAFKIPIIGLFGAFKSELRMKTYQNAVGLDAGIKCSPCFQHGNYPCDFSDDNGTSFCMLIHNLDQIMDEAMLLLFLNHKLAINYLNKKSANIGLAIYKEVFKKELNEND